MIDDESADLELTGARWFRESGSYPDVTRTEIDPAEALLPGTDGIVRLDRIVVEPRGQYGPTADYGE